MRPDPSFSNVRVLVAGGSRGIGLAIARAFATAGAGVSICARDVQVLAQAAAGLQACGAARVHQQACDLADADQIAHWVDTAAQALGGIDIVVNTMRRVLAMAATMPVGRQALRWT